MPHRTGKLSRITGEQVVASGCSENHSGELEAVFCGTGDSLFGQEIAAGDDMIPCNLATASKTRLPSEHRLSCARP